MSTNLEGIEFVREKVFKEENPTNPGGTKRYGVKQFLVFPKFNRIASMYAGTGEVSIWDVEMCCLDYLIHSDAHNLIYSERVKFVTDLVKFDERQFLICGMSGCVSLWDVVDSKTTKKEVCGVTHNERLGIIATTIRISEKLPLLLIASVNASHELVRLNLSDGKITGSFVCDDVCHFNPGMKFKKSCMHENQIYISGVMGAETMNVSKGTVFLFDHEKNKMTNYFDPEEDGWCLSCDIYKKNSEEFLVLSTERFVYLFETNTSNFEKRQKYLKVIYTEKQWNVSREFQSVDVISDRYLFVTVNQKRRNLSSLFGSSIHNPTNKDEKKKNILIFDMSRDFDLIFSHDICVSASNVYEINKERREIRMLFGMKRKKRGLGINLIRMYSIRGLQFEDSLALQDMKIRIEYIFTQSEDLGINESLFCKLQFTCRSENDVNMYKSLFF